MTLNFTFDESENLDSDFTDEQLQQIATICGPRVKDMLLRPPQREDACTTR